MDTVEEELDFSNDGDGIDIYVPREDGEDPRALIPPSPMFTWDSVYKFSDQILRDRHLFCDSQKRRLDASFISNEDIETEEGDKSSQRSDASSERDRLPNIAFKKINLSLDISKKPMQISDSRRFNEPLSSYLNARRKIQMVQCMKGQSARRSLPDNQIQILTLKKPAEIVPPFIRRHTFASRTALPPLRGSRHEQSRSKSAWVLGNPATERRVNASYGKMPTRPSSKPQKIWRQSTDILLVRQTPSIGHIKGKSLHLESQTVPEQLRIKHKTATVL